MIDKSRFIENNKKNFRMIKKTSEIDNVFRLIDLEIYKKGWNRRRLAQALNKTESWLSNIMNKRRKLSIQMLFDIAKSLEIDPSSLLPKDEDKTPHISFEEYIRRIIRDELEKAKKE